MSIRSHLAASLRVFMAVALTVMITGCLTIEENYTFKKDGSGTMEYVVDMTDMAEMMKGLDTGSDKKKGPAASGSEGQVDQLKALEGIKKVKLKDEQDGYLQRISFAFSDVDALNRALDVLMPDSTGVKQAFFRWEGNTLVRTNNRNAREMGDEMNGDAQDSLNMMDVLKAMKYKYTFKFADEVASTSLADGMVKGEAKKKRLALSTDWSVIMQDPKALDLRITLAK